MKYVIARNHLYQQVIILDAEDGQSAVGRVQELSNGPDIIDAEDVVHVGISYLGTEPTTQWYVAPMNINAEMVARVRELLEEVAQFLEESLLDDIPLARNVADLLSTLDTAEESNGTKS